MHGSAPQIALLPDKRRLHLNHGPIDLIVEGFGEPAQVAAAYRQAATRFRTILDELVAELPALRRAIVAGDAESGFTGPVARRMARAVAPHHPAYVTPMAAVAGAVADEVLAAMLRGRRLMRAYANNGGDIALHLAPGQDFAAGVVARPDRPTPLGSFRIGHAMPVRGIATSGQGGRSLSLGIADAVTVLAVDAAAADAAATLIGNAVNVDHAAIRRMPARQLDPDSDLGNLPVTVSVGRLEADAVAEALDAGLAAARAMREQGLIHAAVLALAGEIRVEGEGLAAIAPTGVAREGTWSKSGSARSSP